MKKTLTNKQGFTLVEVIVAFSVLIMVIVAATNLLVSVIRSNNENENTLVAYGLAQEGLEAVRNMRDSDWLLGAKFSGNIGNSGCAWTECFPLSDVQDYILNFNNDNTLTSGDVKDASALSTVAPWKLTKFSLSADPSPTDWAVTSTNWKNTKLCLHPVDPSDSESNAFWYKPSENGTCDNGTSDTPSLFSRYVEIQVLTTSSKNIQKYLVSSVVKWRELSRNKEVRLTTELTDWKGGPL